MKKQKLIVEFINKVDLPWGLSKEQLEEMRKEVEQLTSENARLTEQLETRTFPLELQYGDLTNYIGYGQSETEKLVAISFGVLKEKGSYFGEEKEGEKPLFIAYFDRIESLEVLENLVNIGKARLAELEAENGTQNN